MEAILNNSLAPYSALSDLNTDGRPPGCRVGSAEQARAICQLMLTGNDKRFSRNALIKGMVDGNSPWPQDRLDASNQQYRANFNTGEAESYLNVAKSAFYDLNSETETLATVICEWGEDVDKRKEWGDIMTDEFQKLQKKDDEFNFNNVLSQHDMVLYGGGPRIFDDQFDWRGRPMKFSQLMVPDDAASDTKRWVQCCYAMEYRTDELYAFIKNGEAATKAGWDVKAVKDAIIYAASTWQPAQLQSGQQWEWNQQQLRNNDIYHGNRSNRVAIFRLFWREFAEKDEIEGKISEAWVVQNQQAETYLFKKDRKYETWRQIIHPFFYDGGDGTAHSVRGIGVKMYKALLAKMRLDNATVDSALARTAIMLKPSGAKDINHPQHRGPYTILPPDSDFVQQAVGGVLDAPIAVSHELGNTLQTNLSQYRARVEPHQGNPRTKYEVQSVMQQQSALNKTQISFYYEQLDHWYAERFRRAASSDVTKMMAGGELAMAFQKACKDKGVPKECLKHVTVTATRAMGQGNAQLRIETLMMILERIGGALPEQGKQNLLDDCIAAMAGQSFKDRYNPKPKITQNDQNMIAWLQVAAMKEGISAVVTGTQNHAIFATVFAQAGSQAAQSLQQGGNPQDVAKFLEVCGQGLAAHLQFLAKDPTRVQLFKQLEGIFKKLAQFHDQLIGKLQEQAKAQQEQQAKTQQALSDEQIDQMKTAADIRRKDAKQQHGMQLKTASTRQSLAISDAKAASEIRNQSARTQAEIESSKRKAEAVPVGE